MWLEYVPVLYCEIPQIVGERKHFFYRQIRTGYYFHEQIERQLGLSPKRVGVEKLLQLLQQFITNVAAKLVHFSNELWVGTVQLVIGNYVHYMIRINFLRGNGKKVQHVQIDAGQCV